MVPQGSNAIHNAWSSGQLHRADAQLFKRRRPARGARPVRDKQGVDGLDTLAAIGAAMHNVIGI
jgi:hypothetical protein